MATDWAEELPAAPTGLRATRAPAVVENAGLQGRVVDHALPAHAPGFSKGVGAWGGCAWAHASNTAAQPSPAVLLNSAALASGNLLCTSVRHCENHIV